LFFLHPLLLLDLSLLQLLRLLLVPLLSFLFSGLVGILPLHPLVFLLLLLLEFLPFLFLFGEELFLLLLVFPVAVGIPGGGWNGAFKRWKVLGMDCGARHVLVTRLSASTIGRRVVRRSCLFCGHDGAVVK
jgi:hypothetical protein